MTAKYTPTIGIETHVQLKTKTKLFSAVDNDARGAQPNSLISHIDAGLPGALPVLNEKALELTARAAFALNTKPQKFSKFDRKHYFYPDLPKGYQITQYDQPLILGGHVDLPGGREVGITRVHLEEDAGKNTHPAGTDYSLVDLNRAGTPLIEIVSEPDIHSASEAKAYVRELYLLMKYTGVSDCDLYLGHMRFDVNVSVSRDPTKPGIRAEIKNLNSFRSVEAAIEYEIHRQTDLLEAGQGVTQETRGWDEAKQKTTSQRTKEEAEDYRYMPEPDIPPIELTDEFIAKIEKTLPPSPAEIRNKLNKLSIDASVVEDILDRPPIMPTIMEVIDKAGAEDARRATFWLIHAQPATDEAEEVKERSFDAGKIIELSRMVDEGKLNSTAARKVFDEMQKSKDSPAEIASKLNLIQVSDESELERIVAKVVEENPKVVADIKAGQEKAIGFLVGQVMAASGGQANPALARQIITKLLG